MAALTSAIVAGSAIVGTGVSAAGAYNSYQGAKGQSQASQEAAAASKKIAEFEQQIEAQKFKAMEIDARRRSLESVRLGQRARSMGLAAATSQGAGAGSGLQGGYGQASGQLGTSLVGISQNLEIGRNIFGLNSSISQQKMAIADAQAKGASFGTQSALGSGLSSLGSSIAGSGKAAGGIFGGASAPSMAYNENNKWQ